MRLVASVIDQIDRQQGHLFPWVPVFYGAGIAGYFALKLEPERNHWIAVGLGILLALVLFRAAGLRLRLGLAAFALVLSGFAVAGIKAHRVAEQVLEFRYYGPIEGRIVAIDRSASDAVRLTLDRVALSDVRPKNTPARVRVALHGQQGFIDPEPGVTVILTGHLSPPGGAVEPGGYDFRRQAWFQRIGAVGYTRNPVLGLAPHQGDGWGLWIYRVRMRLSAAVQEALPGREGGFASAITTGDRSGMDQDTLESLRKSNLAHLLAISGLHMGLLTGFIFAAVRVLLAAVPAALYLPTKKIAAVAALMAGAVYLALSGGNVATERAFIMVGVMFGAVLVDRRAITLRSVAVAAMIVLTLKPEALYGPGFQMSFSATTALVAVYGMFRMHGLSPHRWPSWMRLVGGVAFSSLVAGLATAPIAAAHFNQVPHYGLIANVVSVPLMGAVIIPAAVLAAILSPLGLGWIGLVIMKPAIGWILGVAETVSSWPGSVSHVIAPDAFVLPILALGAIWLVVWQGRARLLGGAAMGAALLIWGQADRPMVLVSHSGGLVGVMTDQGRALSKPRGDGFAAEVWLENDGDPVPQVDAHARVNFKETGRKRLIQMGAATLLHATGKTAAAEAIEDCKAVDLVIVNVDMPAPDDCAVFDRKRLDETGSLALSQESGQIHITTASELAGKRLWSR